MTGWWSRRYAVRLSGIVGPQGKVFAEVDLWAPMAGWWSCRYAVRLSGIVGPQGKVFAEVDLRLTMAVRR